MQLVISEQDKTFAKEKTKKSRGDYTWCHYHSLWDSQDVKTHTHTHSTFIRAFAALNRMPLYAWRHLRTSSTIANKTISRNTIMVSASKKYQGRQVQNYPAAYADYKSNLIEAQKEQA